MDGGGYKAYTLIFFCGDFKMRFALSAVYLSVAVAFSTGALAATYATPIIANGSNASITKDDAEIEINVTSGADAVLATNGGKIVLGGEQTNNISIYAETSYDAVSAYTSSIDGTRLDILANQSVVIESKTVGLWAQSGKQETVTGMRVRKMDLIDRPC